jgi:hypothetical protein
MLLSFNYLLVKHAAIVQPVLFSIPSKNYNGARCENELRDTQSTFCTIKWYLHSQNT